MFNFHHVGYVVKELAEPTQQFSLLGYNFIGQYNDDVQDIRINILEKKNSPIIELILPMTRSHSLNKFLGEGESSSPYHIAYMVANLEEAMNKLRSSGFIPTMKPGISVAFDNKPFIFFFTRSTGLIELIEE